MKRFIALLFGSVFAVTRLSAGDVNPEAKAAIQQVISAQVTAWNAGNLEGFMLGYLKSDDIRFLSGDHITRGWATVLARYQKRYPDKETMGKLTLGDFEFTALGPDAVLVVGRWKVETSNQNSQQGVTSLVFRQTTDGWRIEHDHTS